ncbi:MAG: A/G-specific adenine glycosylase [Chloroflexi bacterium]|nr:A/G-specific adenine glycosylase [Chloroflexota bacterium]
MSTLPDPQICIAFTGQLLAWFTRHARDLPWRQDRTPYRVWVAEVMLQQTQVETVIPYYERFLIRFPTIQSLSSASLEDVLKVWEGLGYYARARNLHATAQQVVSANDGQLPDTFDDLLALPGVGRYIAGAVASIAFGRDVPAVDGNARRVLCRVFRIREDVTRSKVQRKLEVLATNLLPAGRAGVFNEALMELGATICTPRAPRCDRCPLGDLCQAHAEGVQETLPVKRPRKRVPHYDVAAAVTVRDDGRVLVAQRNVDDMLGGMWEFPGGKRESDETLPECLAREMREELDVEVDVGRVLIVVKHAYTHFRITLHAFCCGLVSGEPRCVDCAAFRWVVPDELNALPMSVADRKVAQAFQSTLEQVT